MVDRNRQPHLADRSPGGNGHRQIGNLLSDRCPDQTTPYAGHIAVNGRKMDVR